MIKLTNIYQIASPVQSNSMDDIELLYNKEILIEDGIIKKIDDKIDVDCKSIDCLNSLVTPGYVDSHTHLVFGGYREKEYKMRLEGKSYVEIMNAGGGILNSVRDTKKETEEELFNSAKIRLKEMLSQGITTVEIKSGYGLDKETELKQLRVIKRLKDLNIVDIVSTYLGAHEIPNGYDENSFIDFQVNEMLPLVKKEGLAEFADIFTEKNIFEIESSRRYLKKAKELGFKLKMHADEIFPLGGAELAAELKCISADHLLKISEQGIIDLKKAGTIATLLPLTAFSLKADYARARDMIDSGLEVALATDFNPGSCHSNSIALLIALSTNYMGMTMKEVLTALTLNGAKAIDRSNTIGSIEVGKRADLLVHKFKTIDFIPYYFGVNSVSKVIRGSKVVIDKGGQYV